MITATKSTAFLLLDITFPYLSHTIQFLLNTITLPRWLSRETPINWNNHKPFGKVNIFKLHILVVAYQYMIIWKFMHVYIGKKCFINDLHNTYSAVPVERSELIIGDEMLLLLARIRKYHLIFFGRWYSFSLNQRLTPHSPHLPPIYYQKNYLTLSNLFCWDKTICVTLSHTFSAKRIY